MSTRKSTSRKKTSPKAKKNDEEPPTKKQKGIDMSHIPASLINEGYADDEPEVTTTIVVSSKSFPDYLKCPVCKDIFVSPEMYYCGHTVCKLCSETKHCPVCRGVDPRGTTPNFTLKDVIANQFPEIQKQRQKELDDIMNARTKVAQYPMSARYDVLAQRYDDFVISKRVVNSQDLIEHLIGTKFAKQTKLKGPVKEQEAKFLIANRFKQSMQQFIVGDHILYCPNLTTFLSWMESDAALKKRKKGNSIEYKKWLPVSIFVSSRPSHAISDGMINRIAGIADLDVGNTIPLDEWKNQPSNWIKDVDIGEVKAGYQTHRCDRCGLFHDHSDSDDDDDSDDDSDMW